MLHKLVMPAYQPQLDAILDFQYHLLSFACTLPTLPLNETMLKKEFGQQNGDWLSKRCWKGRKNNTFYNELAVLIIYVTQHPLEGPEILIAFRNDRDFYMHLNDPDFEFLYPNLTKGAKNVIAPLMVSFYSTLLETGFPESIHLYPPGTFTRKLLLKGFYAANADLQVCPGCDGPPPILSNETLGRSRDEEEETKKRDYAQVDHFFPKASYPFFSVHFMNLVPLCPTCNSTAKQYKDPLNKCIGKGALQHTFLPFIKPATPCIEVTLSSDANKLRKVLIKDTQQVSSQRVKNLDNTFDLRHNWEHHLEVWTESLRQQMKRGSRRKNNRQAIEKKIKKTLQDQAKAPDEQIGQVPYLLIDKGYANYTLKDPGEFEVLLEHVTDSNIPKRAK